MDISKVAEIAKANNLILIVDASQTAGVFPVSIENDGIDILCFTGHKGMLGPQGTGGIVVKKGIEIKPLLSGGSGIKSYSKTQPSEMPTVLEAGTLNGHGLAGLDAAVQFIQKTGIGKIRAREQMLMWRFFDGISKIRGIEVYGDFSDRDLERCPIVALNIKECDSSEISGRLFTEYKIATRPGAHCAPLMHKSLGTVRQGAVRFSFSFFNTEDEIDTAINAVLELST